MARAVINKVFTCPSSYTAQERIAYDVPTYRYRYFGDYPNTRIDPKAGAYHASELPLIFAKSENWSDMKDTDAEAKMGKLMRKAVS